jgi:uncharacterized protein
MKSYTGKLRIVLDTNVLISALLSSDNQCREVLSFCLKRHILFYSTATLLELKQTLEKDKLRKYIKNEAKEKFLAIIQNLFIKQKVTSNTKHCRDFKDNVFIDLALDSRADLLITGDKDLLVLGKIEKFFIVSPKDFVEKLMS